MGISANSGGGAGGVQGFSPFPPFSACVLRTCSEEVIEFPLFTFLELRLYTSNRVYDSSLGFGKSDRWPSFCSSSSICFTRMSVLERWNRLRTPISNDEVRCRMFHSVQTWRPGPSFATVGVILMEFFLSQIVPEAGDEELVMRLVGGKSSM